MTQKSFSRGVLFTCASATSLALTGLFARLAMPSLPIPNIIFWRFFLSTLLCALVLYLQGKLHGLGNPFSKLHSSRALFVLGAQYGFYYYLEKNTLLNAMTLLSTGPLFIPFIEKFLLKSPLGKSTLISLAISALGVVLILQPDSSIFSLLSLVGLLAGFSQGASQVVFGMNAKRERPELAILYAFFLCTLLSLIPALLISHPEPTSPTPWLWLGLLGIASLFNQLTRSSAYQHSTPSRLAPFLYTSVLVAGILDYFVLDQSANWLSLCGALLVVAGGVAKVALRGVFLKKRTRL